MKIELDDSDAAELMEHVAGFAASTAGQTFIALNYLRLQSRGLEFDDILTELARAVDNHRKETAERNKDRVAGENIHVSPLTGRESRYRGR